MLKLRTKAVGLRLAIGLACLLALALVAVLRPQPPPNAAAAPPAQGDYSAVDRYVAANFREMGIPGMAFGLVRGDQVVDLKGYGIADQAGRAVTPQTPFVIGSLSKSFTALAIMQLVEAGKIDVDAPVQRYLPWFRVAGADAAAGITVRELLNQTSGLSTATGNEMLVQRGASIEQVVRRLASARLTTAPGTTWQYSNANYEVLGLLVETVSGQPYGDYVEQHIFAPLDMRHSYVAHETAVQNGLGAGYRLWFGMPMAEPADLREEFAPAGYLVSTAEDLSHYLAAQMNGGRFCATPCQSDGVSILSPAGIATMQAAAVPQGGLSGGQTYGMGWMQAVANGEAVVYHEGDTADMYALLLLIPRLHYGVVLLANGQSLLYFVMKPEAVMTFNLARLLAGRPAGISFSRAYLIFDLAVLALVVLQGRVIFRLLRRPAAAVPAVSRLRQVILPVLALAFDLVVAILALRGLPAIFGAPWTRLWRTDLGLFFLAYALLHLITAAARLWRLVQHPTPALAVPTSGSEVTQGPAANEAQPAAQRP